MERREFLKYTAAAAGVAATGPLTAGRFAPDRSRGTTTAASPVKLSLLLNHTPQEVSRFEHIIGQFEKANPGITVSVENDTTYQAYLTTIDVEGVGHTLPDVFYDRTTDTAFLGTKGWLLPLNSYIAKTPGFDVKDFWPAEQPSMSYLGNIYTLPWNFSVYTICINKTIFKKAGVPLPNPNWTWREFQATGLAVQKGYPGPSHYAADITNFVAGYWPIAGPLVANGGGLISADYKRATTTLKANVDILNLFVEMHSQGMVPNPDAFPTSVDPFVAGLEAMCVVGSWNFAEYPETIGDSFEWEVYPVPYGTTGKRCTTAIGGGFVVSAFTHNPEPAFQLASWLTSTAGLDYVVSDYLDSLPARQSSMPDFIKAANKVKGVGNVLSESKLAVPFPIPPYFDPLQTAVANRIDGPIFTGSPVLTQLEALGSDIDTLIKEYYP
jgi:multiple sugar transport system substrate-binding protein